MSRTKERPKCYVCKKSQKPACEFYRPLKVIMRNKIPLKMSHRGSNPDKSVLLIEPDCSGLCAARLNKDQQIAEFGRGD